MQEVEVVMALETPSNEAPRKKNGTLDRPQQQIDPLAKQRADPNDDAKRSQKQPGQDLHDPNMDDDDGE